MKLEPHGFAPPPGAAHGLWKGQFLPHLFCGHLGSASPTPLAPLSVPAVIHVISSTLHPHCDLFSRLPCDLQAPAPARRERPHSSRAGREVAAGVSASGRREHAGTCPCSELIPRATPRNRPSCLARFAPVLPRCFAWDYTVEGCLCYWVWDFKLVEPICCG